MKFSCDRCDAQYMISDEKVGPNGVKVRCKKCSNVILVRRAAENDAASAEVPAPATAPTPTGEGLDAELGQAFDAAFGGVPGKQETPAPVSAPDPDSTQAVSAEEAANLAARSAPPEPAATEWYVAIGHAQVGPLPLAEVRRKWEAGDVGPDSLVWRPGMGDWAPLKGVTDLAAYLAPVPRGSPRPRASATPAPVAGRAAAAVAPAAQPAAQPRADVSWKPVGASALAALASEELSAHAAEARAEAKPAATAKSLVDALPDGGGVDPTGAIPLQIKALEHTDEAPVARSSVARGAERLRKKRSSTRALVATIVVLLVGLVGVAGYAFRDRLAALLGTAPARPEVAAAPPAAAPAHTAAAPAVTQPAAPPPVAPPPSPAAAVATAPTPSPATATTPPAPPPAVTPPAPPSPAVAANDPAPAKAEPVRPAAKARTERKREPPARTERVARADPPPPPPATTAPARTSRKSNDILDFDSGGDAALDEALGGKGSGRTVYVPPAPGGGGGGLPDRVSDSQVNETIMTRVSALQQCLAENKSESGGVLKMRWSISPDGAVQNLRNVTPETANTRFASCVTGVLKTLRFPKTQQGRPDVTFPFKF